MRISALEDHSLRCLSQLARSDGRLTIGRIADQQGLSVESTAKILARLREAGLIESFRGKDGGYRLARPSHEIALSEVLAAVGGDLFEEDRCRGGEVGAACVHESDCGIRPVWTVLAELVERFLSSITLADLVGAEDRVRETLIARGEALRLPRLPHTTPPALARGLDLPLAGAPAEPER